MASTLNLGCPASAGRSIDEEERPSTARAIVVSVGAALCLLRLAIGIQLGFGKDGFS
jgi:hypothetical protein